MSVDLDTELGAVDGIVSRHGRALAKADLYTVEDLLWRLPARFEDRSQLRCIAELEPEVAATVRAEVRALRLRSTRRRGFSLLEVDFADSSGQIRAVFFNQIYLREVLTPGSEVFVYGSAERRRELFLELVNPQVEPILAGEAESIHTGRVVPIYGRIDVLGPKAHRTLVHRLLGRLKGRIGENLPEDLIRSEGLLPREAAFREAHFPSAPPGPGSTGERARERLIFEELFVGQLRLAAARAQAEIQRGGVALAVNDALRQRLRQALPFRLTMAQRRVLQEIARDLERDRPMRRLLQGDVGAGKTVVAALAMAIAAGNRAQAALMAPTELLAEQHSRSLERLLGTTGLLGAAGFASVLVTGSRRGRERTRALAAIASGEVGIVVGTHALLEEGVRFPRLALAVIDEQHRFGVIQRERLGEKGERPHVLVMTATPIPRSLALTVYGDLDLSVIDELPPGRTPIRTVIKTAAREAECYDFVRRALDRGEQAYVVCPLVQDSEKSDLKAAEDWAETVASRYFRGHSVGFVHGRMRAADRSRLMQAFAAGSVAVLVGTTVIEVGVDVAAATTMVIEHAERFGLSQLHQLRGRIGRGRGASTCILMVRAAVSDAARERLEMVRATSDGFRIAEADLKLRGPGDVLGTRQWGLPSFRVANVLRDHHLLERARAHAARYAADAAWRESSGGRRLLAGLEARARTGERRCE